MEFYLCNRVDNKPDSAFIGNIVDFKGIEMAKKSDAKSNKRTYSGKAFQACLNFMAPMDGDLRECLPLLMEKRHQPIGVVLRSLVRDALKNCTDLPEDLRNTYYG